MRILTLLVAFALVFVLYVARYYISPPWTMWLAAFGFTAAVGLAWSFWRRARQSVR